MGVFFCFQLELVGQIKGLTRQDLRLIHILASHLGKTYAQRRIVELGADDVIAYHYDLKGISLLYLQHMSILKKCTREPTAV